MAEQKALQFLSGKIDEIESLTNMAEQKPLVAIEGKIRELPEGDTIAGGGGGNAIINVGPDFGDTQPDAVCNPEISSLHVDLPGQSAFVDTLLEILALNGMTVNAEANCQLPSIEAHFNNLNCQANAGSPQYQVSARLAAKDSWVETVSGCIQNTNHNASDLQVSGTSGQTKDAYISFDLSAYPANSTVVSARLILHVVTAPLSNQTINIFDIADAGETWSETGITCSNRPAVVNNLGNFASGTTSGVEIIITLPITRLDARMGTSSCTFVLQNASSNLLSTIFESKDEATNSAQGPRLELTFTAP